MDTITSFRNSEDTPGTAAVRFVLVAVSTRSPLPKDMKLPLTIEFKINGHEYSFIETADSLFARFRADAERMVAEKIGAVQLLATEEGLMKKAKELAKQLVREKLNNIDWDEE